MYTDYISFNNNQNKRSFDLFNKSNEDRLEIVPVDEMHAEERIGINRAPQITWSADGSSIGLIRAAKKIRKAVFQGGGVKGLCYPVFIRELGANFLKDLDAVTGSSIGAVMAFLVASGIDMETVQNFISQADILTQISGDIKEGQLGRGLFGAGNLMASLRNLSVREAQLYYEQIKESSLLHKISASSGFEHFIDHAQSGFQGGLTFNDFKLLHRLNPAKFKQLHITAYDRKKEELLYYDADNASDVFCHLALRASIALPHVLKPIVIDGRELSDGGEGSNVPLEVFSRRADYDPEETVLFIFDRMGTSFQILHQPPKFRGGSPLLKLQRMGLKCAQRLAKAFAQLDKDHLIQDRISSIVLKDDRQLWHGPRPSFIKRILGGQAYVDHMRQDAEKISSMLSNVYVVPHGKLRTINFNASKKKIQKALKEAAAAARSYAKWREGMASYRTYRSGKEALDALTDGEKDALIAAGLPHYARQRLAEYLEDSQGQIYSAELQEYADRLSQNDETDLEVALELLRYLAKETNCADSWHYSQS